MKSKTFRIPFEDLSSIPDDMHLSIYARSKNLRAKSVIKSFQMNNVDVDFLECDYLSPFGKLRIGYDENNHPVCHVLPKIPFFETSFLKLMAGIDVTAKIDYTKIFENIQIKPKLTVHSNIKIINAFGQNPHLRFKFLNKLNYGIGDMYTYAEYDQSNDTKMLLFKPFVQFGNVIAGIRLSIFEKNFGVFAISQIKKQPIWFNFSQESEKGIKVNVGTQFKGKRNYIRFNLENGTQLLAQTHIHFAPPMSIKAWMKTPIYDTEQAQFGGELQLDYNQL